jgi:hypothetical protein
MAILLPPVVIIKISTLSRIQDHVNILLAAGIVKDFKRKPVPLSLG